MAYISAFLVCRLIALDKNPGVRPIGVSEIARRIVANAIIILSVTREDIQEVTGTLQLCAGQAAGAEAVVHAMRESFSKEDTEAIFMVDATNAFNSLNRQAALHNIRHLFPSIATMVINTYRDTIRSRVLLAFPGGYHTRGPPGNDNVCPWPPFPSFTSCPTTSYNRGMQITPWPPAKYMMCVNGGTN